MATVATSYGTLVDAYLGPRDGRFFGEGFKRVEHDLRQIVVSPGEPARIDALARIVFPVAWSTKGATAQRPHLSTIDVLVIGAQLAEALIAHTRGLSADERRDMRLRQVRIRAGREPQEDDLDEVPVSGRVTASTAADSPGTSLTTVECSIATLTMTCTVHHATGRPAGAVVAFDSLAAALGDPALRTYGAAYKAVRQIIDDIDIADDGLNVTAAMTLESAADPDRHIGMDARTAPSMVDVFVTGLQLGQVLLYRLDRVPRSASNTLWMRRTLLTPGTGAPDPARSAVTTTLENPRLLPLEGTMWRSADIVTRVGDATMRCSVAHALPPIEVTT